ncbi:MAG: nucleoside-diphosphate sugar epimerase/dehydratase [Bacteriovoracaceae bacterium]|nr:nucleoside-diphosphate sugar epimerase/dehydratase [Bacteriovoracaceae bacterium]
MIEKIKNHKLFVANVFDLIICACSVPLALLIRFNDFNIQTSLLIFSQFKLLFIASAFFKILSFSIFKVSRGLWKFASIPDLRAIVKGAVLAEILIVCFMFFSNRMDNIPRSVFLIDLMLTVYLMGGGRLAYRFFKREKRHNKIGKSTLVVGAGSAAEKLLREYENTDYDFHIIGLLDDSVGKIGRTLLGHKVLGNLDQIGEQIKAHHIEKIIIAIPSLSSIQIRKIVKDVNNPKIELVTIPSFKDIVSGKISLSQLRPLDVNDLLGREPVRLNLDLLNPTLKKKTVLVTGAGGSIGSELVFQLANIDQITLVLFDSSEFFLYELERKLKSHFPLVKYVLEIGDVRDKIRLEKLFQDYRPQICYHAAAYKHVPLMESNPHESVKVNIFGTKCLLQVATDHKIEKFVLISTDKAVRPTSVMGATKKVAEMLCQKFAEKCLESTIVIVRFGNVLASNGSVVPLFLDQIKAGGPVTITHKEMTRYFMSIPEASQLVLQASTIGKNGNIMVLDMGEPVKILDLAKQLIQLNGLVPDVDIQIKETGMRPGEKLYEELFYDTEKIIETSQEKIFVSSKHKISDQIWEDLILFETVLSSLKNEEVRQRLCQIISNEAEDIHEYLQ